MCRLHMLALILLYFISIILKELTKTRATLCGALAGMTTKLLLLPLDTIKKRLEVDCQVAW